MDVKFSPVTACPKDGLTWLSNSFKLQCPNDTLGRSLYQCVPNDDRSSLVEFCLRGSIGRYEAETCPFAVSSGHLDAINCSSFLKGCLKEPYLTNEVYKYPTCLEINPQKSYYLADGICINKKSHEIPKSTTFIQPTASSAYTLSTDSFNLTWVLPNSTSDSQPGIDTVPIITGVVSSLIVLVVIFVIFLFLYSKKCRSCSTIKSTEKDISLIQKQHKPKEEVETCNIDNELVPIRPARKQETSVKIEHESMKSEHGAGKYNFYCEPEMSERTAIEESTNLELLFDFVSRQLSFTDLPFVSTYIGEPQLAETAYIDGNPSETYCKVFHMWRCKYPRIDHKAKLKEIFSSMERQDLIENIDMFSKDSFYYKESLFNPKEQAQSSDFILMSQNLAMKSNHVLRFLGLKQCDIDQIERDNRTTQEKILRALSRVQEDRLSLTRQSICNALYYADHSDVIDILNSSWNRAARKIAKKGNRKKRIPEKNSFKDGTRNNTTWTEAAEAEDCDIRIHLGEIISSAPDNERPLLTSTDITEANIKPKEREKGIAEIHVKTRPKKNMYTRQTRFNSYSLHSVGDYNPWKTRLSCYSLHSVGDYNPWKTRLSYQFSTLTDDEVSVLFCFLCSDSGPPDFTDTEWLDMLNRIRQKMYGKENPVTREEAQQTLDRLKSRDYFLEDQDKITEDTKDETMYRIASINSDIPFLYSSYDTARVYLRSSGYKRRRLHMCVISNCDHLLILRLQMNILTHVTMEDTNIYKWIHKILNISKNKIKRGKVEREEFLTELRREGEAVHYRRRSQDSIDHVTWLHRYGRPDIVRSCIGLHPHCDIYIIDNKSHRKTSKMLSYSPEVRCLLYCLLISDNYQISILEQSHKLIKDKIIDRYFPDVTDDGLVDLPDEITETRDGVLTFISDDIRHDVMYAFVTECLVEDSDLEFFLTTASRDVISEYCRSWEYKRSKGERCLYVPDEPEKMYDLFIDSLQLDIITHCTVSDNGIHDKISKRLGIPEEILKWDLKARERYVEYAKRGTQTVHHARGMIVGCAGAGKTTLLKRLLGCSEEEIKEVKSTEGLEVHEEIFDICDQTKSLNARNINTGDKYEESSATHIDSKTLTFFDFGGQCAYYACHQIYLTRRAFYVVVVDASKRLDQKVDKAVCDQDGSVFSGWTYGDYFVFWIKSIHTYCVSDNEADPKPTVLIVVTHWEEGNRQYQSKEALLNSLQHIFPKSTNLSMYITEDNVYFISFPVKPLQDLERIVSDIALHQRWKENIPKEWAFFEIEINQRKQKEKVLNVKFLTTKLSDEDLEVKLKQYEDMLRYYHDAGKVLYFNEDQLKEYVIIDVQWFIDAFKYIITDKLHFKGINVVQEDWDEYYTTGNLKDKLLAKIWKHKGDITYNRRQERLRYFRELDHYWKSDLVRNMANLLLIFMQRLGLVALGQKSHYIPCMNRKEMEEELLTLIKNSESKSSVLIYRFTFLPFLLFFRLVVACMQETGWKVLTTHGTSCLYKDAAFFLFEGYHVVLSVTEESIQLQVLHSMPRFDLEADKTQKIQEKIENILNNFVGQFNRNLLFVRGVICHMENAKITAKDIKENFLLERDIPKDDQDILCPLHQVINRHIINPKELTKYWNM